MCLLQGDVGRLYRSVSMISALGFSAIKIINFTCESWVIFIGGVVVGIQVEFYESGRTY